MLEFRCWKIVGADKGNIIGGSSQEQLRIVATEKIATKKPSKGNKRAH